MGVTKKRAYQTERLENAQTARGIAHPARMTIIDFLRNHEIGSAAAFGEITLLHQATISQHLRVMEQSHLVETEYLESAGPICRLTDVADDLIVDFCLSVLPDIYRDKLKTFRELERKKVLHF